MKVFLSLLLMASLASAALGESLTRLDDDHITSLDIDGKSYSGITKVSVSGDKVVISFPGGGAAIDFNKVATDFLESWNISKDEQESFKAAAADHAIKAGYYREVQGVIYDTRNPKSGWLTFHNLKVFQIIDDGALVDPAPNDYSSATVFLVRGLSSTLGDTDYITFTAMPDGTYSYINKNNDERTIRAYTVGKVCDRSEIPEVVLNGKSAYAALAGGNTPQKDVVATLPESDELYASGSGFFISEDGYFLTNDHVVKNARRVKLKIGSDFFKASVVREDADHDLALLKAEGTFKALHISSHEADLGQAVFTIGFPDIKLQGTEPKYTDGKISSVTGLQDNPDDYQISVPVQPGNSGGPLVDTAGNIKGIIVARLNDFAALQSMGSLPQNVNYAIKGRVLRQFVSQSPDIILVSTSGSQADGVATVRQAVALVLVYH